MSQYTNRKNGQQTVFAVSNGHTVAHTPALDENILKLQAIMDADKLSWNTDRESKNTPSGYNRRGCRWLGSIWVFVSLLCTLQLLEMLIAVYTVGMTRTLEKQFGLSSTQTNAFLSLPNVSFLVLVLVVSHFGKTTHRPRMLSACSALFSLGCCIIVLPHLLFGATGDNALITTTNTTRDEAANHYCVLTNGNGSSPTLEQCSAASPQHTQDNRYAYGILLTGYIITGFGEAAITPLGFSYIDDNCSKSRSAFLIGIVSAMQAAGPVLGFVFASFCNKIPVNLKDDGLSPSDPRFIGCWWLGYVIFAVVGLVLTPALFLFPRSLKATTTSGKRMVCSDRQNRTHMKSALREFARSVWKILSTKGYAFLLACYICTLFVVVSIFLNLPRYNEIYYYRPAFIASLVAGISGPLGSAVGMVVSGSIMSRLKVKVAGAAKIIVLSVIPVAVGLVILLTLTCPQTPMAGVAATGNRPDFNMTCNKDCGCTASKASYRPVCDASRGMTYYSPCHAGCKDGSNKMLDDCSCTGGNMTVTDGPCQPNCDTNFALYAVVLVIISVCGGITRVPLTMVQIRIVHPDQTALSLGLGAFIYHLLCFIPGPIVFGVLIDSTCLLWEESCGERGACLMYNNSAFRLIIHCAALGFIALCGLFGFLLWLAVRKPRHPADQYETTHCNVNLSVDANENKAML